MVCEYDRKRNQTLQQRIDEIVKAMINFDRRLIQGNIQAKVGPQGAVTFLGLSAEDRDGITDACIYRRIMATGSALAKQQIAKAELLAGVKVDKKVLASGTHSHDGGKTWHGGHK